MQGKSGGGIRVKNASISRLLYFTRYCIRDPFYAEMPFSKTRAERGRMWSSLVVELVSTYVKQNETPSSKVVERNSLHKIISLTIVSFETRGVDKNSHIYSSIENITSVPKLNLRK